jgi:hypothetical protein
LNLNLFAALSGVFSGSSKKETAADGSSVEHRNDKAAMKGKCSVEVRAVYGLTLIFVVAGAGAGNFSALGAADVEQSKKSHQGEIRDK